MGTKSAPGALMPAPVLGYRLLPLPFIRESAFDSLSYLHSCRGAVLARNLRSILTIAAFLPPLFAPFPCMCSSHQRFFTRTQLRSLPALHAFQYSSPKLQANAQRADLTLPCLWGAVSNSGDNLDGSSRVIWMNH